METVLSEDIPSRARWWNSVALVPRFVGTILDLLHEASRSSVPYGSMSCWVRSWLFPVLRRVDGCRDSIEAVRRSCKRGG